MTISKTAFAAQGDGTDIAAGRDLAAELRLDRIKLRPHSARAMVSMLRKDAHAINRVRRDTGESCYRLEGRC